MMNKTTETRMKIVETVRAIDIAPNSDEGMFNIFLAQHVIICLLGVKYTVH